MARKDKTGEYHDLAAEYVLGTLDAREVREAEHRMIADKEFREEVHHWQKRLAPLLDAIPPVRPPEDAFAMIMHRIESGASVDTSEMVVGQGLEKRLNFWRRSAIAASFIAVALLSTLIGREITRVPEQRSFVAVLEANDRSPAFVASIDMKQRVVHVLRVGAEPEQGKSFELWALGAGRTAPESLGVIGEETSIPAQKLNRFAPAMLQNTTFAISLEPEGGSPTGKVTGPVLFTGKLLPLTKKSAR